METKKVFTIVIIILFCLLVSCFVFGFTVKKEESPNEVVYPNFSSGYTLSEIHDFAINNNIRLSIEREYSEYEEGTIISQSKAPGTIVNENDEIIIYIADVSEDSSNSSDDESLPPSFDDEDDEGKGAEEGYKEDETTKKLRKKLGLSEDDSILESSNNYYSVIKNLDEDGKKTKAMLVDKKTYKVVLSETSNVAKTTHSGGYVFKDDFILVEQFCVGTCSNYYSKLYSKDLKLIASDFNSVVINNNIASVQIKNNITKYDSSGKVVDEKTSSDKVLNNFKDYALVQTNDSIILKSDSEQFFITKMNSNLSYHESFEDNNRIIISIYDKSITAKDYINYLIENSNPDNEHDTDNYTESYYEYSVFCRDYIFDIETKEIIEELNDYLAE